jgi:1-acyl-sn-glycerol-3-phosphate acyltransferase
MLPRPVRRILAPLFVAVMVVLVALSAVACVVGLLVAAIDKRARLLRSAAMLGVYAGMEAVVLILMLATWILRAAHVVAEDSDRRAVGWALSKLLSAARALCGFQVELEEPSNLGPFEQRDPVLVLARHGGIGDSFALVHLLLTRYQRRPRVVLKRTLLWDPMLDVALTRLGACWVGPTAEGSGRDAIGDLAARLRPEEAMLLFPEGENWTPRRRTSVMARLRRAGRVDAVKAAALMEHVLPPKPGGVVACLDARPDMPIVIIAHTGLDKITSLRDLWRALPFDVPMRVRWWPAARAPATEEDRLQWLTTEWAVVDEWIDAGGPRRAGSHLHSGV